MEYKSFEKAMTRLETIVGKLEAGEIALEDALRLFEEGVKLSEYCSERLDEAEEKVKVLMNGEQGQVSEEPFQLEEKLH